MLMLRLLFLQRGRSVLHEAASSDNSAGSADCLRFLLQSYPAKLDINLRAGFEVRKMRNPFCVIYSLVSIVALSRT